MSIPYQFIPAPTEYTEKLYNLKGDKYRVVNFITNEIVKFFDTRQELRRRFSYRYIAKKLEINYGNIGRILNYLQEKGLIIILEKGRRKLGTLIQLAFNPEEKFCCTGTTKEEKISCTGTTIKETFKYKEINKHGVVSSIENNQKEEKKAPEEPQNDTNVSKIQVESIPIIENLPPPPPGVHKHTVRNVVKILIQRGITDLISAFTKIIQEMAGRTIQNINGYFTSLAKTIDFNCSGSPSSQGSTSPATQAPVPQEDNLAAVAKKAQEENDRKFKEENKQDKNPLEQLKEYEEKYPEIINHIKETVRIKPSMDLPMLRASVYIEEFKNLKVT